MRHRETFNKLYRPLESSPGRHVFETDDPRLKQYPGNRIWTLTAHHGGGREFIMAGRHLVNRLGYLVTEVHWEKSGEEFAY